VGFGGLSRYSDIGAFPGQAKGDGLADPAGTAGDQDRFILEDFHE
jgi:hypothetical protein